MCEFRVASKGATSVRKPIKLRCVCHIQRNDKPSFLFQVETIIEMLLHPIINRYGYMTLVWLISTSNGLLGSSSEFSATTNIQSTNRTFHLLYRTVIYLYLRANHSFPIPIYRLRPNSIKHMKLTTLEICPRFNKMTCYNRLYHIVIILILLLCNRFISKGSEICCVFVIQNRITLVAS